MTSLVYSNKVLKFQDLFEMWEPFTDWRDNRVPQEYSHECELTPYDRKTGYISGMRISVFCSADLRDSRPLLKVWPRQEVLNTVLSHTIHIAADTMNFNIIQGYRDDKALVVCNHSVIIGGVWLAHIRLDSIPRPAAWEQP
jgi:hypothetical protein